MIPPASFVSDWGWDKRAAISRFDGEGERLWKGNQPRLGRPVLHSRRVWGHTNVQVRELAKCFAVLWVQA